jgi:hypothetical protein
MGKAAKGKAGRTAAAVSAHRKRLARRGFVRVEVAARRADVELIRQVARALAEDPARREPIRAALGTHAPARSGKELLAALACEALPDEVDALFERDRSLSREIKL